MKRIFDIVLALAAAPLALLLVLVCAMAIRRSSPGPVLFRQVRVGINEQPFTCLKLRTMYVGTANLPSHHTSVSAVTPAGEWLRRLKLDELPQLLNILRGEMSFVGPRPCLPTQVELIAARRAHGLAGLRPGITGISQVAGVDMSEPRAACSARRDLSQRHVCAGRYQANNCHRAWRWTG
jgi:O-antigen biosynthesis protein WbqP